jgi:hypothetical protein
LGEGLQNLVPGSLGWAGAWAFFGTGVVGCLAFFVPEAREETGGLGLD